MANSQERTFGENLNTWVQTIGIIVAALWAAYTFGYKEIMVPKSVPVNITLNLQLKKIGTGSGKRPLLPIEMRTTATNPSSRTVYLLSSAWIARAYKLVSPHDGNAASFNKLAADSLKSHEGNFVERHSLVESSSVVVVAVGSLFPDETLKPGETLARTVIFHVPPDKYDELEVKALMPHVKARSGIELEWTMGENSDLDFSMYRVSAGGERKPTEKDKTGSYSDEKIGFAVAVSAAELPLRD